MTKSFNLPFTQNQNFGGVQIVTADASNKKTLITAGANDTIIKAINVATDETVARVLSLYYNDGVTDHLLGAINIPIGAGSNGGVVAVDLLNGAIITSLPYDGTGKRVIPMKAGHSLKVLSQSTLTAAKTLFVQAFAEDF